jgi:hypothetical protein
MCKSYSIAITIKHLKRESNQFNNPVKIRKNGNSINISKLCAFSRAQVTNHHHQTNSRRQLQRASRSNSQAHCRRSRKRSRAKLKKQLPAFTPSGTFESGRKAELLTQYSGFVILDLDKLSPEDLERAKSLVALAPYTFAAFISPSGNGLKIIVPVNSTAEHHKLAFQQVSDYYEQALQLVVDPSGKDVSRLCFMSYDPIASAISTQNRSM